MPALPLLSLLQATADPTTRPANGRLCMAIASAIMLVAPSHAIGQPVCKPALVIKQAGLSAPFNLQRIWRAAITVDASQCATNTGLFSVWFIRGIENGPDMAFAEPFIWHDGDIVIRVDFWHDESVVDSQLADVAACRCREGGNATRSSAPR